MSDVRLKKPILPTALGLAFMLTVAGGQMPAWGADEAAEDAPPAAVSEPASDPSAEAQPVAAPEVPPQSPASEAPEAIAQTPSGQTPDLPAPATKSDAAASAPMPAARPDYYTERAKKTVEDDAMADGKPHPLQAAHPDQNVVVCEGGCASNGSTQIVFIEPRSARKPITDGIMIPSSSSAAVSSGANSAVTCEAGCYGSMPRTYNAIPGGLAITLPAAAMAAGYDGGSWVTTVKPTAPAGMPVQSAGAMAANAKAADAKPQRQSGSGEWMTRISTETAQSDKVAVVAPPVAPAAIAVELNTTGAKVPDVKAPEVKTVEAKSPGANALELKFDAKAPEAKLDAATTPAAGAEIKAGVPAPTPAPTPEPSTAAAATPIVSPIAKLDIDAPVGEAPKAGQAPIAAQTPAGPQTTASETAAPAMKPALLNENSASETAAAPQAAAPQIGGEKSAAGNDQTANAAAQGALAASEDRAASKPALEPALGAEAIRSSETKTSSEAKAGPVASVTAPAAETDTAAVKAAPLEVAELTKPAVPAPEAKPPVVAGPSRDAVVNIETADAEMANAIQKARGTLAEFWSKLEQPGAGESDFSLKVAIEGKSPSEVEHFWLTNIARNDGKITGTISNDPSTVKTVKRGQTFEVKPDKISDWLYKRNGKMVGNETMRPLLKRLPAQQAAAYRAMYETP